MSVIAPFDGQVLYIESQSGDVVDTESTALEMANLGHLYIEAKIGESDIASVSVGDPITATLGAVEGLELAGQVAAIDPLGEVGSDRCNTPFDRHRQDRGASIPALGSTANVTIELNRHDVTRCTHHRYSK
jgi:hypothetical protein